MSRGEETLQRALDRVASRGALDEAAMSAARAILDSLTKPPGSLGRLESVAIWLAGVTGEARPAVRPRAIIVAAADHGVTRQGVSGYPAEVTAQMVANFLAGGAAINVLAGRIDAALTVLDVGVAAEVIPRASPDDQPRAHRAHAPDVRLVSRRIRPGTEDMTVGPAMGRTEALDAIAAGIDLAEELARDGVAVIGVGEMGIGNTTAASAVTAAMTGAPTASVTGFGTGIDDETRAHKIAVIDAALDMHRPDPSDPIGVLSSVGGLEIGALTGVILGAVGNGIPVVLDGFITGAAALLAAGLGPYAAQRMLAAHRSLEPGHAMILDRLGLQPLLDLDLRLGEATGAALAIDLLDAAVAIRDGMATFDSAAISGRATGTARPVG